MKVLVDQDALSDLISLVAKNMTYIACVRQLEAVTNSMEAPKKETDEHDPTPERSKKAVARADK